MKVGLLALVASALWLLSAPAQPALATGETSPVHSLYVEDQRDRDKSVRSIDWVAVDKADTERRAKTRSLLAKGELKSGQDFEEAAFVFQHGETSDDILLAHTLAVVAVSKGRQKASWIACATLDRYLLQIGKAQVYGTQFQSKIQGVPKPAVTQDPYDRNLISDSLRQQLGVPVLEAQESERLKLQLELSTATQ